MKVDYYFFFLTTTGAVFKRQIIIGLQLDCRSSKFCCATIDGVEYTIFEYEYRKKLRVRVLVLKNVLEYEYY